MEKNRKNIEKTHKKTWKTIENTQKKIWPKTQKNIQ